MKQNWKLLAVAIVFGVILYWAYTSREPGQIVPKQPQTLTDDRTIIPKKEIAPEISLKDTNDETVKLSDYKGKIVILNFWASWSSPAKMSMPEIDAAAKELAQDDDAVVLAVNMPQGRETIEKARKYIADNNFSMKVLFDTEGMAAYDYNVASVPTTFIINKEGKIHDHIAGVTTKAVLVDYVNKLK